MTKFLESFKLNMKSTLISYPDLLFLICLFLGHILFQRSEFKLLYRIYYA